MRPTEHPDDWMKAETHRWGNPEFVTELPPEDEIPKGAPGVSPKWIAFRNALDAHPGVWARYPGKVSHSYSAKGIAYQINRGSRKTYPADLYEAAAREAVVYMRRKP